MISKIRQPLKLLKISPKKFSFLPEKQKKEIKDEFTKLQQLDEKIVQSYEPQMFKLFNSKYFLEQLAILTRKEKKAYMGFDLEQYLRNSQIPFFLLIGLLLFSFIWMTVPFTVIFKHLSISEYTLQRNYFHTLLTSSFSIQKFDDFILYYPQALLALTLLPKNLGSMHFSVSFGINFVICGLSTLVFYSQLKNKDELLLPKFCGSNTCVFFMSLFTTIRNDIMIYRKAIPLWFIPAFFMAYEIYQTKKQIQKTTDSNLSHFGNIVGLLNGVLIGTVLKKKFKLFDL